LALQGTLDTFSLPDVLRLLATTSKTGRLRIEGDRGQGSVWMSGGGIVDADADRAIDGTPIDEVVFELMRFSSGSFAFDGGDTARDAGKPEDVEALLRRANSLLSEWTELEAVVPSLEHQISLASDLSVDEVTIDADRWRSLVAIASARTVGELATALGLSELGVSRAVRDLVDLGVAEVEAPGTGRGPDLSRRAPVPDPLPQREPRPQPEGVTPVRPAMQSEPPRAGWRQTGEVPAVGGDRHSAAVGNGQARSSLDDTGATPPPAPPKPSAPPTKGGLASRLGRNRNAGSSRRGGDDPTTGQTPQVGDATPPTTGQTPRVTGATPPATGQAPPATGSTPRITGQSPTVANGSARPSSRPPAAPPARTNDLGRPRNGTGDAGSRLDPGGAPRHGAPGGRQSPPPAAPSGPRGRNAKPGSGSGSATPSSPFDGGRLGPPPTRHDTGQIRPVNPSSLPPDLHWAADDTGSIPLNGAPPSSPFSGLTSLGPTSVGPRPEPARPAPKDGEIAPHVAAMSPAARAAVQATLGNAGGSTGRGPAQGDDVAPRGRLISFLSTVR
jgi:Domain of unknown function (DUF4388)